MQSSAGNHLGRTILFAACLLGFGAFSSTSFAAAPVVSNVRASQRTGTKLVDIYYDLADADSSALGLSVAVSTDGGLSYTLPANSLIGAVGSGVEPGTNKKITWDAGADWNENFSSNVRFRVTADDAVVDVITNLISNGGFEGPSSKSWFAINSGSADLASWTVGLHSVDVVNTTNWLAAPAFDGVQAVDLDGTPGPGEIKQSFPTISGTNYYLTFAYANNFVDQPAASATVRLFDASGDVLGPVTISHSTSVQGDLRWQVFSNNFTAREASMTLEFTSLSSPGVSGGILIDAVTVRAREPSGGSVTPGGMVIIPAGSFMMGNAFSDEGYIDEAQHAVNLSAFYMDKYEVTKASWDKVYNWAIAHNYSFEYGAQGKASNHPALSMTWYDCVKWCNARSESEGRTPAYYTDAGMTARYRSGQVEPYVNWSSGYRLPTEAEWEKAARGGASGHRFPWADTDNIMHSRANFESDASYAYDVSPTRGYHPTFNDGVFPYTSPVGHFAPNGYELYDMAGNVWEWCWDWYGVYSYSSGSPADPRGPASGSDRVTRGGGWSGYESYCRVAGRGHSYPADRAQNLGFRSILPQGQ